jgi:hypothetical protein
MNKIKHFLNTSTKIKELATIFRAEIKSLSHAAYSWKRGIDFRVTVVERDDLNVEGTNSSTGLTRGKSPTSQRTEVSL